MKNSLAFFALLTLFSSFVFAKSTQFVCNESYGMGVQQGFSNENLSYQPTNPQCFAEGILHGKQIRVQYANDQHACRQAYDSGYTFGIEANVLVISNLPDCAAAGYTYGTAQLTVSARAGDVNIVGEPCVKAYRTGFSEGQRHEFNTSYSTNIESRCYQTGWSDAVESSRY